MTRLYNGGTQPLVPCEDGWGEGVVMPGESIETDRPETYGTPWTEDAEATASLQALLAAQQASSPNPSDTPSDGVSEAQDGSQAPSHPPPGDGPQLHTLDNGDVVDPAGNVVGHIDAPTGQGGNA